MLFKESKMTVEDVVTQVRNDFANRYVHFRAFQFDPENQEFWNICIDSLTDKELLKNIIFCNDVLKIPPIKTFLTFYRDDFIRLTGNDQAILSRVLKQSIGAFWGMVFKFVFGYRNQRSGVSVAMTDYFLIRTATVYSEKPENFFIN